MPRRGDYLPPLTPEFRVELQPPGEQGWREAGSWTTDAGSAWVLHDFLAALDPGIPVRVVRRLVSEPEPQPNAERR